MSAIRTFNVEAGMPTLDEARRLVIEEIKQAKRAGARVLKVIHGYGSSGTGGKLCVGLRKSFGLRKKEGIIKDFIAGEDFSIFNETVLVHVVQTHQRSCASRAGPGRANPRAVMEGLERRMESASRIPMRAAIFSITAFGCGPVE
jgi:hypothetical protein